MTASAMQQVPVIPPRPTRSQDKDNSAGSIPTIPPRPAGKRFDRSVSPNPNRFAPSPLLGGIPPKSPNTSQFRPSKLHSDEPIDRSGSVPMPSVGEEGVEYSAVAQEIQHEEREKEQVSSPEQTRTVADDLQLYAPKPSLPAHSAKQRVAVVTRTDSDRAASFGLGRPAEERATSRNGHKKKPSTTLSTTSDSQPIDDEHGIPEIGQRVPMNPHLGDVQAPSPGPGSEEFKRHHQRKHSARGGPPGSYGLHGHGVAPQDKLDKEYYQKHPELREKEHYHPLHDRQNDFAMSSNDLNKLVHDTASRGAGMGTSSEYRATPTDEVAFHAHEEYTSRMASPQPPSNDQEGDSGAKSTEGQAFRSEIISPEGDRTIHVDDAKYPEFRSYGDGDNADAEENGNGAPILASDEVGKAPNAYLQHPAVHPGPERRGSAFEMEDTPSRPSSRNVNTYLSNSSQQEFEPTPLEDVKEYEPLFPEDGKKEQQNDRPDNHADEHKARHYFPSKDVWEDAPSSVHYTAEVSTPEVPDQHRRKSSTREERPETPAHLFARHQEELAEREAESKKPSFVSLTEDKPTWAGHQAHLKPQRPAIKQRFPSRDVWEDTPESLMHQTTVSSPQVDDFKQDALDEQARSASEESEHPSIPERPKPRQTPSDERQQARPAVSEKPKPQIPPRPSKSPVGDAKDGAAKAKPPVPSRPMGGKIAALQAGFMSDLNKRLKLGPQAPKKEEETTEEAAPVEEKEKAPLSDARKGRARGPQRRAPAKATATPAVASKQEERPAAPVLVFSAPQTFWSIDPETGDLDVSAEKPAEKVDEVAQAEAAAPSEKPSEQIPEEPVGTSAPIEPPEPVSEPSEPAREAAQDSEVPEAKPDPFDQPPKQAIVAPVPPVEEHKAEMAEGTEGSSSAEPIDSSKQSTEASSRQEQETLVANMAGESVLEATVEKKEGGDAVEPVEVEDKVKA